METGFRFEIIYKDVHLMELRVCASNGSFEGVTDAYVGLEQLGEIATKLEGFPTTPSDVREIYLGNFEPDFRGGWRVSLRFYCVDQAGHTCVDAMLESRENATGKFDAVVLSVPTEPLAVDVFVEELRQLDAKKNGRASLKGNP